MLLFRIWREICFLTDWKRRIWISFTLKWKRPLSVFLLTWKIPAWRWTGKPLRNTERHLKKGSKIPRQRSMKKPEKSLISSHLKCLEGSCLISWACLPERKQKPGIPRRQMFWKSLRLCMILLQMYLNTEPLQSLSLLMQTVWQLLSKKTDVYTAISIRQWRLQADFQAMIPTCRIFRSAWSWAERSEGCLYRRKITFSLMPIIPR